MSNYCPNCGCKSSGGNFCPKCGQNLKTLERSVGVQKTDDHEEESSGIDISRLKDKIKITIETPKNKVMTVGEVIQQAKSSGNIVEESFKRPTVKLPKGKDKLFKVLTEECSSSKQKSKEA